MSLYFDICATCITVYQEYRVILCHLSNVIEHLVTVYIGCAGVCIGLRHGLQQNRVVIENSSLLAIYVQGQVGKSAETIFFKQFWFVTLQFH